MSKVKIELEEKHLISIRFACEWMSRFLSGQVSVPDALAFSDEITPNQVHKAEEILANLKQVLFPELSKNQSYGINSKHKCKTAGEYGLELYDFYRSIYHFQAIQNKLENPDKTYSVYDYDSRAHSKVGKPKIEKIINE